MMERLPERIKGERGGDKREKAEGRERACQPTAVTIIHHHKRSGTHMHAHTHTHARTHARTHACMHACMHVCTLTIGQFSEAGLHK